MAALCIQNKTFSFSVLTLSKLHGCFVHTKQNIFFFSINIEQIFIQFYFNKPQFVNHQIKNPSSRQQQGVVEPLRGRGGVLELEANNFQVIQ